MVTVLWDTGLPWVVLMTARCTLLAVTLTLTVEVSVSVLELLQVFDRVGLPLATLTVTTQPVPGTIAVVVEVMTAVPGETPVTRPPGEVTVAIVSSELDQVTESPPTPCWLPSEYLPVTVSWAVLPVAIEAEAGSMKVELSVG